MHIISRMAEDKDIISYLNHEGERIAFHGTPGRDPGLFFVPGYLSDMTASKAQSLAALATTQGLAFTSLDYMGHGQSSGRIEDGDLSRWLSDALAVFDQVATGRQVLIGSSMGGWIALLIAKARPERVQGIIGMAAAPDFTEDLIKPSLTDLQKAQLASDGIIRRPEIAGERPYFITKRLLDDAAHHLIMSEALNIACPMRLLHGLEDSEVPWQTSVRLARHAEGADVQVTLIKGGSHRLSRDEDLRVLHAACVELVSL